MKITSVDSIASGAGTLRTPTAAARTATSTGTILRGVSVTLTLLSIAVPAMASTYYVSQAGNDANSCVTAQSTTQAADKRSIAAGVACLSAGDTLFIRSGTYTNPSDVVDSQSFPVATGTAASRITIAGFAGETVTIQPPNNTSAIRLTTGGPSYLTFQNLTIDMINNTVANGAGATGVYFSTGSSHNRMLRLIVKNNSANGIGFSSNGGAAAYNELVDSVIFNNGRLDDKANAGYGLYMSTSNNLVDGSEFYGNNGYGIHMNPDGDPGGGASNIIRNSRIHDNFAHGTGGSTGGSTSYGIALDHCKNAMVYNNLIYHNQGGILIYSESMNAQIYQNTIYNNIGHDGGGENGIDLQYYGSAPIIRNNIIWKSGAGIHDYGGTGTPTIDHNLMKDPLFVDAAGTDFRLNAGSAAQDTGTSLAMVPVDYAGVARPQGTAYDIGAFEFGSADAPSLSAPTNLRRAGT